MTEDIFEIENGVLVSCYWADAQTQNIVIPSTVTKIAAGAFAYSEFRSITIPNTVTEIGDEAFKSSELLMKVCIPDSVRKIGSQAFYGCELLQEVVLSNGSSLAEIGDAAFMSCKSLVKIHLPNGVQRIAASAFSGCELLQEVIIPNNLRTIEEKCFAFCSALSSITLPRSVTIINSGAFQFCKSLSHVDIPDGVFELGANSFSFCSSLTAVQLPASLRTIGEGAFENCSSLKQIDLPTGIVTIPQKCFSSCKALTNITLPDSTCSIEENAFDHCETLERVVLPSSVKHLSQQAFNLCTSLHTVSIPENLESCTNAFSGCEHLVNFENLEGSKFFSVRNYALCSKDGSVLVRCNPNVVGQYTVDDCVREILPYAFSEMKELTAINIPICCTVRKNAIYRCENLQQDNGFVIIGDSILSYCGEDNVVTVPSNIKTIGDFAFADCETIEEIILPQGLREIGEYAFSGSTSLRRIEITSIVNSIGKGAFAGCSNLEYISIPSAVKIIPEDCFYECSSLKKVDLHEGLEKIEDNAFCECDSLTELKIPYGTRSLGEIGERRSSLTRIYIPETVTEISSNAFSARDIEFHVQQYSFAKRYVQRNCFEHVIDVPAVAFNAKETKPDPYVRNQSELVTFLGISDSMAIVPNGIETIGVKAFSASEIERVVIPESVTTIKKYAFFSCKELKEVIILGKSITIEDGAFDTCPNLQKMVVFASDISFSRVMFKDYMGLGVDTRKFCFYGPQSSPLMRFASEVKVNYVVIDSKLLSSNIDNIISACEKNSKTIVPSAALTIQDDTLIKCDWAKLDENCSIAIPNYIIHIADGAFKRTGNIAEIILPEGLKTIGKEVFKDSSLQMIQIPSSVEEIGDSAFEGCHICEITLPPIQELKPYVFQSCYDLERVSLPDSLMSIGASAFSNCLALKGISLPKRLVEIGEKAFDQCHNLLYVILPDSVVEIADNAFSGCFDCVYLCNEESYAREYAKNHYYPAFTYAEEIITNVHKRETLKANNKNLSFNYLRNTVVVPGNYAIAYKVSRYYTPKAEDLYQKFISLFENIVHGVPGKACAEFLSALEQLAEQADYDLKTVGIYLKNARGYLYCLNPTIQPICNAMTAIVDFLEEEDQNAAFEIKVKSAAMLDDAESQVTGVNFGIITNSALTYAVYAMDDYLARVKQREKASKQLHAGLDALEKGVIERIEAKYAAVFEQSIKPLIKELTISFVQELVGMIFFHMELHDILPKNTKDMYDYDKAGKLLTTELLSSYQKGAVLGRALSYCPYNMDVYRHIFDEGFQNDVVYQIAAAVGIEKEVASLYERSKIEKEQRRREEEKRKIEEAKRRREQELLEQQRKEKEAQERARNEKKEQLETQIGALETELSNLRGLFTGKKKEILRKQIEELQRELEKV